MNFEQRLTEIKQDAKRFLDRGAVTENYPLNVETAIGILNRALATELVCVLRYRQNWQDAEGLEAAPVAQEFLKHSQEEQAHADQLAERISQLGGKPDYSPAGMEQAFSEFKQSDSVPEMIRENLVAERVAIDMYRLMIDYFGSKDPTTRRVLVEILADEEHHADEMAEFLERVEHRTAS